MKKILLLVIGVGVLVILFFALKQTETKVEKSPQATSEPTPSTNPQNEKPDIISTDPDPLNEAIVSGEQPIVLIFNRALENEGELKITIEPKINFKISLSQDRKTAKIIPQEAYDLDVTYTMFIKGDTKFTGYGPWGEERMFHFRTIRYRGV